MRRVLLILALLALGATLLAAGASGDDGTDGDGYLVRGYFDNAGFLVPGEEVRIAGAKVGSVEDVDVSRPGEPVTEDGGEDPGKAVVVMRIDDPGFQDFRTDASCLIRPQSLLGERFVDCQVTQPHAPGSELPPELEEIGEGEPGAGERFLPLENNGKQVDLDLVNNVMREPEVDRFRLILNDLGIGLAGRGEDLNDVLERANPALQETDKVLAILAEQNKGLAKLAADSDTILTPLAREREHISGFINNAATAGEAAAERRADIEEGLQRFPAALEQIERTMPQLRAFAEAGTPVAANLRVAAPGLTGATRKLKPFAKAGTTALLSLGEATETAGPDLAASDPVIRQLTRLAKGTTPWAKNLRALLGSLRKTGGIDQLMAFIVNASNVFNGFDSYGHFLRAVLEINNCLDYQVRPKTGCIAKWTGEGSAATAAAQLTPSTVPPAPTYEGAAPEDSTTDEVAPEADGSFESGPPPATGGASAKAAGDLLEFLTKDGG